MAYKTFHVTVTPKQWVGAVLTPNTATWDVEDETPADLETVITWNDATSVKMAVSDITQLATETERAVCSQPRGGHGDESETSTMLYIREDLIHMDKAVEEYSAFFPGAVVNGRTKVFVPSRMCTPHGINGNSRLATKEKGEKILFAMVDALEQFLAEFTKWEPGEIK